MKHLSSEQLKEVIALEKWFLAELKKIKKRQLQIMKKYDQKKSLMLKKKIRKSI